MNNNISRFSVNDLSMDESYFVCLRPAWLHSGKEGVAVGTVVLGRLAPRYTKRNPKQWPEQKEKNEDSNQSRNVCDLDRPSQSMVIAVGTDHRCW